MSKYGMAKFVNHERVWRSAMTIEYLAQEEIGAVRRPGEDLLIELVDQERRQITQSIGYVALGGKNYRATWPVLTTIRPAPAVTRDVFRLVDGDAKHEIFYSDCRQTAYGSEAVEQFAARMLSIERALRDPAVRHYVEFEPSGAYNLGG